MRSAEIAWSAGIVDGEGCITISIQQAGKGGRINPSHRLYVKVTMGHRPTIERLHALFGVGSIHEQRSPRWNTAWSWWVAGRQAAALLRLLRPYLVTKAEEADVALEFAALPAPYLRVSPALLAERQHLFEVLRDLKPSARFRKGA